MADKVKRAVNLNNPDMAYIDAANDNSSDVYGDGQIDDGLVCLKFFQVTSVEGLKCLKTIPIFLPEEDNTKVHVVTFAAVEDLTLIAVGLINGNIILYRGNIFGEMMKKSRSIGGVRTSFKTSRDNYNKDYERFQIVVINNIGSQSLDINNNNKNGDGLVTNLHFYNPNSIANKNNNIQNSMSSSTVLYVTTPQRIVSYANLDDKSDEVLKFKNQVNSKIRSNLYNSYDYLLNDKYKIKVNENTLDRMKNYFR